MLISVWQLISLAEADGGLLGLEDRGYSAPLRVPADTPGGSALNPIIPSRRCQRKLLLLVAFLGAMATTERRAASACGKGAIRAAAVNAAPKGAGLRDRAYRVAPRS